MGEEAPLVAPRFARGCRCFAALADGAVAGYGWLSRGPEWIGELQLEIRPRDGEAYVWNCVTLAPHRRRGVFRSLLLGITETARREGLQRLWIGSVAIPAERAVEPSGFRPALRFTTVSIAGMHIMLVSQEEGALGVEAESVLSIPAGVRLQRSRRVRH